MKWTQKSDVIVANHESKINYMFEISRDFEIFNHMSFANVRLRVTLSEKSCVFRFYNWSKEEKKHAKQIEHNWSPWPIDTQTNLIIHSLGKYADSKFGITALVNHLNTTSLEAFAVPQN